MQCNTIQCNAIQYNAMQCNAMQCNAVQCSAVQCSAVQCSAVQCNAMQCNAIQYNTIQLHGFYRGYTSLSQQSTTVLESATFESLLLQQSTFMPQHSVDVVSYFHSVWGSAALLNTHRPKELTRPARLSLDVQLCLEPMQCTTLLRGMKAG